MYVLVLFEFISTGNIQNIEPVENYSGFIVLISRGYTHLIKCILFLKFILLQKPNVFHHQHHHRENV